MLRDIAVIYEASRGLRPLRSNTPKERQFPDLLWSNMECCWDGDPEARPPASRVYTALQALLPA